MYGVGPAVGPELTGVDGHRRRPLYKLLVPLQRDDQWTPRESTREMTKPPGFFVASGVIVGEVRVQRTPLRLRVRAPVRRMAVLALARLPSCGGRRATGRCAAAASLVDAALIASRVRSHGRHRTTSSRSGSWGERSRMEPVAMYRTTTTPPSTTTRGAKPRNQNPGAVAGFGHSATRRAISRSSLGNSGGRLSAKNSRSASVTTPSPFRSAPNRCRRVSVSASTSSSVKADIGLPQ